MKGPTAFFAASVLCLFCAACAPTLMGENSPEDGAPPGGSLDGALAAAVDLALAAGDDPPGRDTDALPASVRGAAAPQAALHKLPDGGINSWRGRGGFCSLSVQHSVVWRDFSVRAVTLRMEGEGEGRVWQGFAVLHTRDKRGVWIFVDRVGRWSTADTLEFYKALDHPGDGRTGAWTGDAGACAVSLSGTSVAGDSVTREFALRVGDLRLEGKAGRQAKQPWRLEEIR
jgi:hypothetical protein